MLNIKFIVTVIKLIITNPFCHLATVVIIFLGYFLFFLILYNINNYSYSYTISISYIDL